MAGLLKILRYKCFDFGHQSEKFDCLSIRLEAKHRLSILIGQ